MNKQNGFTLVEGLLIVLILSVIGFAGYYAWNSKDDSTSETSQQDMQADTENKSEESADSSIEDTSDSSIVVSQTKYSIKLPEGWAEEKNKAAPAGLPEYYHQYSNESGQSIGISINNSAGFGGGGDGGASFVIENNKFIIDNAYIACNPEEDETGACRYGDGKLDLIVGSASEYNGDNYMFWIRDDKSEDQNAYSTLKDIIETIELN